MMASLHVHDQNTMPFAPVLAARLCARLAFIGRNERVLGLDQAGQIVACDPPDEIEPHLGITMNETMAQTGYFAPWDVGMGRAKGSRDLTRRCARSSVCGPNSTGKSASLRSGSKSNPRAAEPNTSRRVTPNCRHKATSSSLFSVRTGCIAASGSSFGSG
jgi:hypothetical protein